MEKLKFIYLVEGISLGSNGEILKRLKVGKTNKPFKNSRSKSYNVDNSFEGYSLSKVIIAPEILENMFHIRFNNLRLINPETNRKIEWMRWNDEAKNLFLSENLFENLCDFLWNNKEEFLSGKNNIFVKKKILLYLQKRNKLSINKLIKDLPKVSNNKEIKTILLGKVRNGLDFIKQYYEDDCIS